MIGFYKKNIDYLEENAVLPDKRRYIIKNEGPKHFIDLDHYQNDSLDIHNWVPKYWSKAKEKFSADTLWEYGVLPWNLQWQMRNLEKAFQNGDGKLILKYSAEIGHYLADAHVPLHTTENYNGQLTNQHGIHGLWESRLVEVYYDDYDFFVGKSKYIDDVLSFSWEIIFESHNLLPNVLLFEKIASDSIGLDNKYAYESKGAGVKKVYSLKFSQLYHTMLNDMVQNRMRSSVIDVGSVWFTAWVNAGQPNLSCISLDSNLLKIETKDSLKVYNDEKKSKLNHRGHE